MLMGILGHIQDYEEAKSIVRTLQAALPSGSYFVHYDSTDTDAALKQAQQGYDDTGAVPYVLRSPEQITAYYEGLELIEPGIVSCPCGARSPAPRRSPRTCTAGWPSSRDQVRGAGWMFWLRRNRLSGSRSALIRARRA